MKSEKKFLKLSRLFYGGMIVFGLISIWWFRKLPPWHGSLWGKDPLMAFSWGLGFALGVVLCWAALAHYFSFLQRFEKSFAEIIQGFSARTCLELAILSGIGEELIFRGLLQPYFGIWITSILFAVVHAPLKKEWLPWPLFALVIGGCLGWGLKITQSMAFPIAAHIGINFIHLLKYAKSSEDPGSKSL